MEPEKQVHARRVLKAIVCGAILGVWMGCDRAKESPLPTGAQVESAMSQAWDDVADTARASKDGLPGAIDAALLRHFIAIVEARVRVPPPRWWQEMLLSAKGYSKNYIRFERPHDPLYQSVGIGLRGPINTSVMQTRDTVAVTIGQTLVSLPAPLVEEAKRHLPHPGINLAVADDRAYIAFHTDFPTPYRLLCIHRRSGDLVWEADVRAGNDSDYEVLDLPEHVDHHWVGIVVRDDVVVIFGASGWVLYIEAFDVRRGQRWVRFATSYGP